MTCTATVFTTDISENKSLCEHVVEGPQTDADGKDIDIKCSQVHDESRAQCRRSNRTVNGQFYCEADPSITEPCLTPSDTFVKKKGDCCWQTFNSDSWAEADGCDCDYLSVDLVNGQCGLFGGMLPAGEYTKGHGELWGGSCRRNYIRAADGGHFYF